ncbi:HAMP domain-containing sensor histidine kinase [Micromonospora sediminicola]|uniref:sensor histidine kinase n=1 Tax=Micromonospora sediminicola TaxID=946078 RepID=UPI0033D10F29
MKRWSLRGSLTFAVAGLTIGALLVAGVASLLALRAYLLDRIDSQLVAAAALVSERGQALAGSGDWDQAVRTAVAPTEFLVEVRQRNGALSRVAGTTRLPARPLLDLAPSPPPGGVSALTTITSTGLDDRYRVVTVDSGGNVILIGQSIGSVQATVGKLAAVEAVVSALVVALLVLLSRLLVARRLRPLEEIAAAATAIADGDLERRVPAEPDHPERTELGRLTTAVNGMLERIHSALAVRAESEDRMRRFAADASHELRTPLTSIRGYAQLLRSGTIDMENRPDVLARIEDESTRMSKIVNDLLFLARLDASRPGDARLDAEPLARSDLVDLAVVVRDSVADALAAQPEREIALDSPPHVLVRGDEAMLRQVMANLLANVRSHTPVDAAACVAVAKHAADVRVEVRDDGPGLPEPARGRIFERFYRADPARSGAGSGLGLAIVAEAVRAHGGSAGVESEPDGGTTVWFMLPLPTS